MTPTTVIAGAITGSTKVPTTGVAAVPILAVAVAMRGIVGAGVVATSVLAIIGFNDGGACAGIVASNAATSTRPKPINAKTSNRLIRVGLSLPRCRTDIVIAKLHCGAGVLASRLSVQPSNLPPGLPRLR